ncbi:MAG TPA: hypothetical protein VMZ52_06195 [Bryobacteraceae bacterium]|nr:hypothetical protein [Bryobacteraceae bacterium]
MVRFVTMVCFVALLPSVSLAQAAKFYQLEFVVKEVEEGKVVNSRSYSMITSGDPNSGRSSSMRTGNRVPVPSSPGSTQFNYLDIGVNIDCAVLRDLDGELALNVVAEISSIASKTDASATAPPVLRQTKWNSNVVLPIRKATVLFGSDDPGTKRKMQLELTATPVK